MLDVFPELRRVAQSIGLELSENQVSQFLTFREALYAWNMQKNLTRVSFDDCDVRHFAESCLLISVMGTSGTLLDMGSGPGFPAWPIACLCPEIKVTALDSNGKMLEFLRTQPLPNLQVLQCRAEEIATREAFNVVTGRAFAPLSIQLECSAGACEIGGSIVPFRGPGEDFEHPCLKALGLRLHGVHRFTLGDGKERALPEYQKIGPTPTDFPRQWAKMKQHPL